MNKKMKLLSVLGLVTAILFLFSPMVTAQSLSISGKVIDKNRFPDGRFGKRNSDEYGNKIIFF